MIRKYCALLLLALCVTVALLKSRVIWQPSSLPVVPTAMSWIVDNSQNEKDYIPSEEGFIEVRIKRNRRDYASVVGSGIISTEEIANSDIDNNETTSDIFPSGFFSGSGDSGSGSVSLEGSGEFSVPQTSAVPTLSTGTEVYSVKSSETSFITTFSTKIETHSSRTENTSETTIVPTLSIGTENHSVRVENSSETTFVPIVSTEAEASIVPTGTETYSDKTEESSEISSFPPVSTDAETSTAAEKSTLGTETSPTTAETSFPPPVTAEPTATGQVAEFTATTIPSEFPETSGPPSEEHATPEVAEASRVYCVSDVNCDSDLNQRCIQKGEVSICGCDNSTSFLNRATKKCEEICKEDYCGKTGTCNIVNGQPLCRCNEGYYGEKCQASLLILSMSLAGAVLFLLLLGLVFGRYFCRKRKAAYGSFPVNSKPDSKCTKEEQIALATTKYSGQV